MIHIANQTQIVKSLRESYNLLKSKITNRKGHFKPFAGKFLGDMTEELVQELLGGEILNGEKSRDIKHPDYGYIEVKAAGIGREKIEFNKDICFDNMVIVIWNEDYSVEDILFIPVDKIKSRKVDIHDNGIHTSIKFSPNFKKYLRKAYSLK